MSQDAQDILQALEEYERTVPESRGLELRLDLAEIVIHHLREKGWTQRELSRQISRKESFISRIVHSDANCTLDTVGRLLFALGIHAQIVEAKSEEPSYLAFVSETGERKVITYANKAHTKDTVQISQARASDAQAQ